MLATLLPATPMQNRPDLLACMSDYKHVNLKDLDDLAGERPGDIEARFGRAIWSQSTSASALPLRPDFRSPFGHRHREQEEAYVVVGGSGSMRLDDEVIDSGSGTWSGGAHRRAGVRGRSGRPGADRGRQRTAPRAATAR